MIHKKISVIIPAYNAESTIESTLDSVFNQTYQNIEIIVVNDGSIDRTLAILAKYATKIKLISTANKGVSHARNTGLKYAKGEFIQYLDADDLLLPNKLTIQIHALQENDADVAYGDWQRFYQKDERTIIKETIIKKITGDIEVALFADFWCPPAVLLYSKKITDQLKWNENLPIIQDTRYLLDAAIAKGKFLYIPGLTAQYRDDQEHSLSKRNELAFVKDCFQNAREVYKIWKSTGSLNEEKERSVIDALRYCINRLSFFDKKSFKEAIEFLLIIKPKYIPERKGALRFLSKLIGYYYAEKIALTKRRYF